MSEMQKKIKREKDREYRKRKKKLMQKVWG